MIFFFKEQHKAFTHTSLGSITAGRGVITNAQENEQDALSDVINNNSLV